MIQKTSIGNKLNGFYRGEVLKLLSGGKCKIWIPGVYPEIYRNKDKCNGLPDAVQAGPIFGGANSGGNGMWSYPRENSFVWCFFENEDQNKPVYFASVITPKEESNFDKLNHTIKVGNSEIKISTLDDDTDKSIEISYGDRSTKTIIKIDDNGTTIETQKYNLQSSDAVIKSSDTMTITSNESLGIAATGPVSLSGQNVKLDGSGGKEQGGVNAIGYLIKQGETTGKKVGEGTYANELAPKRIRKVAEKIHSVPPQSPADRWNNGKSFKNTTPEENEALAESTRQAEEAAKVEQKEQEASFIEQEAAEKGIDPGQLALERQREPAMRDMANAMEYQGMDPRGMPIGDGPPPGFDPRAASGK